MDIDNSRANTVMTCPYLYQEKYETEGNGLELIPKGELYSPLQFGARMHELLEEYYKKIPVYTLYQPHAIESLETEAKDMLIRYKMHYPAEDFDVVDVERTFRVPLPNSKHHAIGKIDLCVRSKATERLNIIDHKTQNRGSKSNLPQKWAARAQASIYLWTAAILYKEPVDNFYVNILMRQSPAGLVPCSFPDRQKLERTQAQIDKALRDLAWAADMIELNRDRFGKEPWPSATEQCCTQSGWQCDFYLPHTYGWSEEIRKTKYQPRTEYLQIEKAIE